MATCEVAWLRKVLDDMGQSMQKAIVIYCDNISNIMLANNPFYHARTKHLDVHYHFVREKALAEDIDLMYVSTKGTEKLHKFRGLLGVLELDLR